MINARWSVLNGQWRFEFAGSRDSTIVVDGG